MVRIFAGAVAAVALGACASTPAATTPAQLVLGKWSCLTDSDGVVVKGVVTYAAGGTGQSEVSVDVGEMSLVFVASADSTWSFGDDGFMRETITQAQVQRGTMNGQDVPPAMIQPMMEEMVVGQVTTSTVEVTPGTLKLTDNDSGTVTNCTR